MANRSSSSSSASLKVSSRTVAIAGATVTLATAGALQAFQATPSYDGSIQLVGILPDDVPSAKSTTVQRVDLGPSLASANIAPPDLVQSIQSDVLHDSAMAAVVSAQLRKQGLTITPGHLLSRLQARTSSQGWLELHYQDTDPLQVETVLEQVAQWYASQDSSCEIQACRDVPFIETQVPILQQQQQQLKQKMVAMQQNLHQTVSAHMGSAPNLTTIEDYANHLLTQQHQQIRQIAQVETSMAEALTELQDYQTQMNLSTVKVQTGFALLHRIIPHYQGWLAAWQKGDRQLLAVTLDHSEDSNPALQALAQRQQALATQMANEVANITQRSIIDMPQPVRELILENVGRFGYMGDWLATLHRLQLLDSRRQLLKQMQQDTIAQAEAWQQALTVRDQLQEELTTTTETLTQYQQRYVVAQQQMAKESLEWQVVSPPEVVQEPGGLSWMVSHLGQTPNPLMTLRLP